MTDETTGRPDGQYLAQVKALRAFDARCWLGDTLTPRLPGEPRATSAAELLALLDRAGVERAVVFHTLAVNAKPDQGNQVLLGAIARQPRLVPGAVLVPDEAPLEAVADLIHCGVRLAALYPASHGFTLDPWCSGELVEALENHRLPVVIPHTEASWAAVRRICLDHPALPVLVEGGQAKLLYHNRILYALMRECPNLHVVTHALISWRMVEDIVSRFGPQRLVFGSQLPLQDPQVGLGMIIWGELAEAAKAAIARGNLETLIAGVRL